MNARSFARVTQVETNPVVPVCPVTSVSPQATPSNGEVEFAKARLESYLNDPTNTVSWSTIRKETYSKTWSELLSPDRK